MTSRTALIVIDMQVALFDGAHRIANVSGNVRALASRARAADVPVIYLQHCHDRYNEMMKGQPGWQIHPDVGRVDGDLVVEKTASDSFYRTSLHDTLQGLGVTKLAVTGMQTEFCVDATCRAALSHGYDVMLVSDGHTTADSLLPAQQIIDYHNFLLPRLAHPTHSLRCAPGAEIEFR